MGNIECSCNYNCFKENKEFELKLNDLKILFKEKFRQVQEKTYKIAEDENKGLIDKKFYDLKLREGLHLKNKTQLFFYYNSLETLIIKILYMIEIQLIASNIFLDEFNIHQIIFEKGKRYFFYRINYFKLFLKFT